jgi:hypothetical protein
MVAIEVLRSGLCSRAPVEDRYSKMLSRVQAPT